MTRFSATQLDLSRVDTSDLFAPLSYQSLRDARMADLKARLTAAGWEYDVETLETDPGGYLQETGAYRELLTLQAIRDAQLSVLLAFSWGEWLDRLGDLHGTARMPAVPSPRPYATNPEDWESDDRYRGRIQLAPEAFPAAGTPGGYIYHAMASSIDVQDIGLTVLNRGTPDVMVELTVLAASGNGVPSDALVQTVRAAVTSDNVKLLTDVVSVRPASNVDYSVSATLNVLPGPDPTMVQTNALASLQAMASKYKRLATGLPPSAITGALQISLVDSVTNMTPANGVPTNRWQFPNFTGASLTIAIIPQ
jgi:phage-related baseplate assembly protein